MLAFDRETGEMRERLRLRPELNAYRDAIKARLSTLAAIQDEQFARPRAIETESDGRLVVVSEFVAGRRLSDILEAAAEQSIVAGLDAGLGVLLELLPAVSRLHDAGIVHGALAPGRIMVTPAGQIVLIDSIYGDSLERLQLTRKRLWAELRLAFPSTAGRPRFDKAADVSHAAMIAAAMIVGRPLRDNEAPDGLAALRSEIHEIASIRGSKAFADGIDKFFAAALPLSTRKSPLTSADEAAIDLRKLLRKDVGITTCRTAMLEFFQQVDTAEKDRITAEQIDRERLEGERVAREEVDRSTREEAERNAREAAEREAREEAARRAHQEAERKERDRVEAERRAREEAEWQVRQEAERKAREEAERKERERLEAERRAREEAEQKAREEAERKERERLDAERRAREEAERKAREEAERKAHEEAARKAREEAERKERERLEAERRAREEAERKAREEAERKAREEAARKAREEAERKAREEAERKERERLEAERRAREEAERKAREEAERKAREEAERRARQEAERKERERLEAERRAREEAERKAREEAEREHARLEAERRERERLEAERKAREETERRAREEAERRAREEAERRERERAEAERRRAYEEAERKERERLDAERRERERLEAERTAREEAERKAREEAGERERLEAERRERERADAEKARAEKETAKKAKSGWLVPPDRAAAFEPPIADSPPAAAPAARAYPIYVPPEEPDAAWTPETQPPSTIEVTPMASSAPPQPPGPPSVSSPSSGAIKAQSGGIKLQQSGGIKIQGATPSGGATKAPSGIIRLQDSPLTAAPTRADSRNEPVDLSAADAYQPFGSQREERPIPWKLIAAGVLLIAATFGITRGLTPADTPLSIVVGKKAPVRKEAPPPVAPATGAGKLVVTSEPDGVRVLVDGKPAGATPLTIDSIAPGRHTITLQAQTGPIKRTVRVDSGKSVTLDVPVFSGFIAISAPFVMQVSEKGRSLGSSDQQIILGPGQHVLHLSNAELNYSADQTVEVESGEVAPLAIDPRAAANINAVPWAEVWIDGEKAGDTPLANVAMRLGTREIVFKNPQFPDRKVVTTIKAGAAVSISVDFTKDKGAIQ